MDTNDTSQLLSDKENELRQALGSQEVVDNEIMEIDLRMLELRKKKKILEQAQSKARHNVKLLDIDIRKINRDFWKKPQTGL
jgi:hypothetical protein